MRRPLSQRAVFELNEKGPNSFQKWTPKFRFVSFSRYELLTGRPNHQWIIVSDLTLGVVRTSASLALGENRNFSLKLGL